MSKNYFHAIATLIGTIIGVGMFSIPYVISKSGIILLFIYLPILGTVQYFLHKIYAEIVLSTKEKHRLPGYAEKYIGKKGKILSFIINILASYGTLLAYIIIGGIFLHELIGPILGGSVFSYSLILFALQAIIVLLGLRLIASVELGMTGLLLFVIGLLVWRGWSYIEPANFNLVSWPYIFLPYGPIFFAVGGADAIPTMCKLLAQKKDNIKSAIAWGTFIPLVVTMIFAFVIVGITGGNTSPDTLVGLRAVLSDGVIIAVLSLGLLSIITSFLITAQAAREIFWWDFGMNKNIAWALACFVPLILYLLGLQNLTKIVSLTGAITGGLIGLLYIWLLIEVKKKAEQPSIIKNKINKPVVWVLSFLFISGLIYEIYYFLVK
ncbi:MAG: aromatic amino acid transport family protein [Patescibacteria group bacterium]|jgi:tyrosine-specific transport protein